MKLQRLKHSPSIFAHLIAIALCLIILTWIMKLWCADLKIPFCYVGDAMLFNALAKGIIDNGWCLHNPYLGMPIGHDMYDFPLSQPIDFMLIRLISIFAHDYAMTVNLYFLITFPLTTLTTMLVFRHFKVSFAASILGSLLFSFMPYHFLRGVAHLNLSAYYMIPPMVMVILWVFVEPSLLFRDKDIDKNRLLNKKFAISALICLLISFAFIYYPFFSCFLLLIAGMSSCISHRNKYPLLNSFILISIILIGVLANISPTLIYQHENGKNLQVLDRIPAESEIFGLKIIQLIKPVDGHRIDSLAKLSDSYSRTAPLVNENTIASLGLIGSIGFLILITWAFFRISDKLNYKIHDILNYLCILNLSSVLLATIGGFGTIFAYLIFPQIRSYNRISIFIAFFSIFAIILLINQLISKSIKIKRSLLLHSLIVCLILLIGVFDQTNGSFVPQYDSIKDEYMNDKIFINNIEHIMPENAMIFQLPYVPFPEYPLINNMNDYSHFRAYLHSNSLRWSYGAMKGRSGDVWQRAVAGMPTENMLKTLSQTGFQGVYLDCYGFEDGGAKLISAVKQNLKVEPLISDNGRLYFFDMTEFNKKMGANYSDIDSIPITFNSGWYGTEDWSGIPTCWMHSDGTLAAFSPRNLTANISLNALSFYRNRTLEVYSGDNLVARVNVPTSFLNVSAPVTLEEGLNILRLHVPEGCDKPNEIQELNSADNRCLSVAIQNISLGEWKPYQLNYRQGFYDIESWSGTCSIY